MSTTASQSSPGTAAALVMSASQPRQSAPSLAAWKQRWISVSDGVEREQLRGRDRHRPAAVEELRGRQRIATALHGLVEQMPMKIEQRAIRQRHVQLAGRHLGEPTASSRRRRDAPHARGARPPPRNAAGAIKRVDVARGPQLGRGVERRGRRPAPSRSATGRTRVPTTAPGTARRSRCVRARHDSADTKR